MAPLLVMTLVVALLGALVVPESGFAASRYDSPTTGMEGGARNSFGPDGDDKRNKGIMTGGAGADAYGNPILPDEGETAPRTRPRPGAYGTRPTPPAEKPLPDLPSGESKWKF